MVCPKCGAPLEDGATFCGNCGTKVEGGGAQPVSQQNSDQGSVFCPNCGKRLSAGDVFCDECGFNLAAGTAGNAGAKGIKGLIASVKASKKLKIIILACVAGVLVVGIGIFAAANLSGGKSDLPTKLVYFKDQGMMMVDLKPRKPKPVELTDSYSRSYNPSGTVGGRYVSKDGKYVIYKEDYDGDTYDLFLAKVSKPKEGKKIDSNVSGYTLLNNNTLLYKKKNSLYYYNGKESKRFAKDVKTYRLDESQKNLYWSEADRGETTYYYQDLAQKKEAVELEDDVDKFYAEKDLKNFYALKGDKLYQIDKAGNKERVADDISEILSFNSETGVFHYLKTDMVEQEYGKFVRDDSSDGIPERQQERLDEEKFEYEAKSLYLFDGNKEQLISDRYNYMISYSVSEKGQYFLFTEYPDLESVEVLWSDMENSSWDSCIKQEMGEEAVTVLASSGQKIGEYGDIDQVAQAIFHSESGKLYISTVDEDGEDFMIWQTSLSGSGAGTLAEYDEGEGIRLQAADGKGLYYLKDYDYDDECGDLYYNKKEVLRDVYGAASVNDGGSMVLITDYDDRDDCVKLSLWNGKKAIPVAEEVNYADKAEDNTFVLLTDYNHSREEGDLMYFDGKSLRKLDEDVSAFVQRDSIDW